MQSCDTLEKRPITSTRPMLPGYTERRPSHTLVYTVATPSDTVAGNSSEHACIRLRMLTVRW